MKCYRVVVVCVHYDWSVVDGEGFVLSATSVCVLVVGGLYSFFAGCGGWNVFFDV